MDTVDKSTNEKKLLLTVSIGQTVVWSTAASGEKNQWLEVERKNPRLALIDSAGSIYTHDLQSVLDEGLNWLYLTILVSEKMACYSHTILSEKQIQVPIKDLRELNAKGLIFQPFFLPESEVSNSKFNGRGMVHRGFHRSDSVTSGRYSLSCVCDSCRRSFRVQSFHAGFSDSSYFYCSGGPHTLILNHYLDSPMYVKGAPPALGEPKWEELRELEALLPECRVCGGTFSYLNPFRCPHCLEPYIDFVRFPEMRQTEYYGNYIYGDSTQTLRDQNRHS